MAYFTHADVQSWQALTPQPADAIAFFIEHGSTIEADNRIAGLVYGHDTHTACQNWASQQPTTALTSPVLVRVGALPPRPIDGVYDTSCLPACEFTVERTAHAHGGFWIAESKASQEAEFKANKKSIFDWMERRGLSSTLANHVA